MKLDDLDRILLSEKPIAPSPSFGADVMSRIQTEAVPRPQLPFPWIPFALSLLLLLILGAPFLRTDPTLRATYHLFYELSEWVVSPADPALRSAIVSAFASLLGTLILLWLSLRLTDAKR
jgi:hypothetical protein